MEMIKYIMTNKKLSLGTNQNINLTLGTDQNTDYLKLRQHKATEKSPDTNLEYGIIPNIHKLTKMLHISCKLIKNILILPNNNINFQSKISRSDMSDHFRCMLLVEKTKRK